MAAADLLFTEEEMVIDKGLGYPIAYSKLCRDRSVSPYSHGPPFTFIPYALQQKEDLRARDLEEMFPIIDPKAKPTAKTKIFVSLLWKQLNHLGNAGFDPAMFRVDPYGNVLYFRAESASPLAWDIDHWFPCSRGGLTVPSNLRILQWQVCNKKHQKLEFLIPWWDLQVGISVNQFLSIFAASNSDFRHRAFSLLFSGGESEELNDSQAVDSHTFPQHFIESKEKVGLAPAAIVLSQIQKEAYEASSALKSLDINIGARSSSPVIAVRKSRPSTSKENENPDMLTNPYQAKTEESAKMQAEIQKMDDEVNELKQKTEDDRVSIQELELVLIKRRRRAEKCRRLAEAQASYKAMLEKMIRDAMHQSVIYKEQLRLNRAAADALMARLEAQKAICESSEIELHRKFRQRDELEKQIRPEGELGRKRSRMGDSVIEEDDNDRTVLYLPGNKPRTHFLKENNDDSALKKGDNKTALCLPGVESRTPLRKELRLFLAEEQKASKTCLSLNGQGKEEQIEESGIEIAKNICKWNAEKNIVLAEGEKPTKDKLQTLVIGEEREIYDIHFPVPHDPEKEEDEESRKQRGKGNVEKWLQILLENSQEGTDPNPQNVADNENSWTDEISRKVNLESHPQEINFWGLQESEDTGCVSEVVDLMKQDRREKNSQQTTVPKTDRAKTKEEKVEIEESIAIKNPPCKLLTEKMQSN